MQRNVHFSILAIAIAAILSLLFAAPAVAHPGHDHDRQVVFGTHVTHVIPNKVGMVVLGKHSVTPAPSESLPCPCCPACSGCAGCCGSATSMPCGSGSSGAAVLMGSSVAGTPIEPSAVTTSRVDRRLSGRTIGPLDKPPRV